MYCMETSALNCPSVDRLALVTCAWSFEGEQALSQPLSLTSVIINIGPELSMVTINV